MEEYREPNYEIEAKITSLDKDTNETSVLAGNEKDEKYTGILFVGLTESEEGTGMRCIMHGLSNMDLLNIIGNDEHLSKAAKMFTVFTKLGFGKGEGENAPS